MKIKNWAKFQHFKNRRPPWIKLHREILDQRDINMISDRSFRVLINCWLLASEDRELEGSLPTIADIAFRIRMHEKHIIEALQELSNFIDASDIKMISERYQVGPPETEGETETENKKICIKCRFDDFWHYWPVKRNKQKARAAWKNKRLDEYVETLITDVQNRIKHDKQWINGFIPHCSTYLNGQRWEDEYEATNSNAKEIKRR